MLEIPLQVLTQQVRLLPGHFLQFVLDLHRFAHLPFQGLQRGFLQLVQTGLYPGQHTVIDFQGFSREMASFWCCHGDSLMVWAGRQRY